MSDHHQELMNATLINARLLNDSNLISMREFNWQIKRFQQTNLSNILMRDQIIFF